MPEMSKAYTPKYMGDKNPDKKILKLGQKITDRIGHKVTSDDPEYWGLKCVTTDDMADIALTMKVRTPYTFEQLCKKNKDKTPEQIQKLLDQMSYIGLLEYNYGDHYDDNGPIKGAPHTRYYVLPLFVPGSAEFTNMRKEAIDAHPELPTFFERMTFLPLEKITHMVPMGGAGIGMHVIPVEKAIKMENTSIDIEHISYWLKKYAGHISAGICSCRYGRAKQGEGCGDSCEDWCLGLGDMADYCVETKKGHYVTYDEAMAILKRAEDNGFVHQITNIDGKNKIFAICNCDINICNALRTSQLFNTPNMSRSSYVAKVDPKNCVACGRCVEYCPAGAVKLGQKLCTKNGPINYPKHELPDNLHWGVDKWTEDYRDKNRINCYETGTSPCKAACPAHIAVQGYLKLAAQGKYQDALALIKLENPLPAICGRVCNRKCEDACTRGKFDSPVAIDAVKKFIADKDLDAKTRFIPTPVIASNVGKWKEKIAIIGAGPAGLSCAYYLAMQGYEPTIFEKAQQPGGMLRYGIPSYKLEKNVIDAEIEVIKAIGVTIKCGVEVGKDITIDQLRKEGYKAFYIAIGCQGGKLPNIPGQDGKNVFTAVDFLREIQEDKAPKFNGPVVVIGGGNVAIDAARSSTRLGATKVSMFCLESRDIMPATKQEIREAEEEHVEVNCSYAPKEVLLDENKNVKGIVVMKCLRVFDENHHFAPQYDENDTKTIDCTAVIFSIGQAIVWNDLLKGTKVEFNRAHGPIADKVSYQTKEPDIFVGGDVYTGPKFAIDAIAEGKEASVSIHRFVRPGASMTIGRNLREFIPLDKDNIADISYDKAGRQEAGMDESVDYHHTFQDAHKTLTEEQVKIETARCLGCGASVVDENKCIGCGICTTKCNFDAIHLFRVHPEASTMYKAEDKMKAILPYMVKRAFKVTFGKKTPAEKVSEKQHKAYKKASKKAKKASKNA
jgi:NADPH-dependent glutamate synthase beta subunit-like oxidoreductase